MTPQDVTAPRRALPLLVPALLAAAVSLAFLALCYRAYHSAASADFMALWLAGQSLAEGRPDLIYPPDGAYFTMLPPPEWIDRLRAEGYGGDVFPYLYPPIWAWIAAKASIVMRYETLQSAAAIVNPMLIAGMVATAWRLAAPTMALWLYLALGLAMMSLSAIGVVAVLQNQPQILVAFLSVLAVERAEHGAPRLAGGLLAIAAAIKLYPALYAVLWLAAGQRRSAASFAIAGAGIALLSVALAGWPLHAAFLRNLHAISHTAMLTNLSYSVESLIAQLGFMDRAIYVTAPTLDTSHAIPGWKVLPMPGALWLAMMVAQIAALGWCAWRFRTARTTGERAALWPWAMAVLALLAPIGWCYYYLATAAFAPMIAARIGLAKGAAFLLVFILGTSPYVWTILAGLSPDLPTLGRLLQATGTLTMLLMAAMCLRVARIAPDDTLRAP